MKPDDLRCAFALANEFKEGDLALGGTRDQRLRVDARGAIGALRVGDIAASVFVDDGVSEALTRSLDAPVASDLASLTIAELKRVLLGSDGPRWAARNRDGLGSEAIAAVAKLMSNEELARVAASLFNPLPGDGIAIGSPGHLGSRIQPNSPGDDEDEILLSILEGLTYGCGDVILGLNPASDDVDTIVRLERLLQCVVERLALPTRFCVLSDIVKQTRARAQTRVDVGFQSLAGTSRALAGIVGLDVDGLADLARGFGGLYFETGQGSEVTNGAAEGVDMVTLEARTYGVARAVAKRRGERGWMIVNDVAGFIGPEVFRSPAQLERACLEDVVMAKLHGLTMGLDVCSTFHMGIEPRELRRLTETITLRAAPAYLMAVAGNADPMLGYLTTSFREHPRLRRHTGRRMATAMEERLTALGVLDPRPYGHPRVEQAARLYACFEKAGGATRSSEALCGEARRKIEALRTRGFDLGYEDGYDFTDPPEVAARIEAIYAQARRALYAKLAAAAIVDAGARPLRVRTLARDRDDYLAHPPSGERISDEDAARIAKLYPTRRPEIQVVISDGLNADAVNENLRALLRPLRRGLEAIARVGAREIVIEGGRVRAGYHAAALLGVDVLVHLIGERPGTGLNTLSAYVTYGRDPRGRMRWSPDLDHAATTAICGIHDRGKPPHVAAEEIVRVVTRMLAERCSGVALSSDNRAGSFPRAKPAGR
jgi:ethanolamine ammonia-lyase large subunit